MNISLSNISRSMPPQAAEVGGAPLGEAASRRLSGDEVPAFKRQDAVSPLTRVAGEERVDEAELRRDDDLGRVTRKAFDPNLSAAALPPLGLDAGI